MPVSLLGVVSTCEEFLGLVDQFIALDFQLTIWISISGRLSNVAAQRLTS